MPPTSDQPEQPGKPPSVERRRSGRVRIEGIRCGLGELADIGAAGMRVEVRRRPKLEPGEVKGITLKAPDGPLELRARVVWVRELERGRFGIGLEFEALSDAQRAGVREIARSSAHHELPDTGRLPTDMQILLPPGDEDAA